MSIQLTDSQQTIQEIVAFINQVFKEQYKSLAVIGVSGGIDSGLSLSLLVRALGPERVVPVLLPFGNQSTEDARSVIEWNNINLDQVKEINIQPMVEKICDVLLLPEGERVRRGNIQARCRMICLFDVAKSLDALVCGTENKSEHYLGYFTRFGDAASDLEPITSLYKTQVYQLASYLKLPAALQTKAPSAGLWLDQSDEQEMGFSYQLADQVLVELIDNNVPPSEITIPGVDPSLIDKVVKQVQSMAFKLRVPYSK